MIFNLGYYGGSSKGPPEFEYTGTSQFIPESDGHWKIKFLTSGVLKFNKLKSAKSVDLFLLGGGDAGETGYSNDRWGQAYGGRGGDGGRRKTVKQFKLKRGVEYSIYVAPGGTKGSSGGNSNLSFEGSVLATSSGAPLSGGGSRTYSPSNGRDAAGNPGASGGYAFDDPNEEKYGGAGGGGGYNDTGGAGGAGGGGHGGIAPYWGKSGKPGEENKGGGGGGGYAWTSANSPGSGGNGGSGIVMIRDAR